MNEELLAIAIGQMEAAIQLYRYARLVPPAKGYRAVAPHGMVGAVPSSTESDPEWGEPPAEEPTIEDLAQLAAERRSRGETVPDPNVPHGPGGIQTGQPRRIRMEGPPG